MVVSICLLTAGLGGIVAVVFLYPALAWSLGSHKRQEIPSTSLNEKDLPRVTMITAARNAAELLPAKIANFEAIDYPADKLDLIVASDASTDGTAALVRTKSSPRIRLVENPLREGKAAAMNLAVQHVTSEILLFSDADALLHASAVKLLVAHFRDLSVGGVCGRRMVASRKNRMASAQQTYIDIDSRLKEIESGRGKITSNDGKLHMIRTNLFTPIPPDVTDDLFTLLSVIRAGMDFRFEPSAIAEVPAPSRDERHEIYRRRRIVVRSLTGIFRNGLLLNPFRSGLFAIGLLFNKVGRRLLPFFFVLTLLGTLSLLPSKVAIVLTVCGIIGVTLLKFCPGSFMPKPVRLVRYMLAGLLGTAWGAIDFLLGRRVTQWEPVKQARVAP